MKKIMAFGIWHCPYIQVFNIGSQDASDVDKINYYCVGIFLLFSQIII